MMGLLLIAIGIFLVLSVLPLKLIVILGGCVLAWIGVSIFIAD